MLPRGYRYLRSRCMIRRVDASRCLCKFVFSDCRFIVCTLVSLTEDGITSEGVTQNDSQIIVFAKIPKYSMCFTRVFTSREIVRRYRNRIVTRELARFQLKVCPLIIKNTIFSCTSLVSALVGHPLHSETHPVQKCLVYRRAGARRTRTCLCACGRVCTRARVCVLVHPRGNTVR
jgi:hypothetical protein